MLGSFGSDRRLSGLPCDGTGRREDRPLRRRSRATDPKGRRREPLLAQRGEPILKLQALAGHAGLPAASARRLAHPRDYPLRSSPVRLSCPLPEHRTETNLARGSGRVAVVRADADLLRFLTRRVEDLVRALVAGVGVLAKAVQIYGGPTTWSAPSTVLFRRCLVSRCSPTCSARRNRS